MSFQIDYYTFHLDNSSIATRPDPSSRAKGLGMRQVYICPDPSSRAKGLGMRQVYICSVKDSVKLSILPLGHTHWEVVLATGIGKELSLEFWSPELNL